jgi:hypothetical protein
VPSPESQDQRPTDDNAGETVLAAYRRAIATYVVALTVNVMLFYLPSVGAWLVPGEVVSLLDYYGSGALVYLPPLTWLLVLVVNLAACAGLYLLSAQARTLFLLVTASSVAFAITGGVVISGPVPGTVALVAALAQGWILALAYTEPLKRRFQ